MTYDFIRSGYAAPAERGRRVARHTVCVQLIATVSLIVSLAVAVTAISIGIARASAVSPIVTEITRLG